MGVQVRDCLEKTEKKRTFKNTKSVFSVQLELFKLEGICKTTERLALFQPNIF